MMEAQAETHLNRFRDSEGGEATLAVCLQAVPAGGAAGINGPLMHLPVLLRVVAEAAGVEQGHTITLVVLDRVQAERELKAGY